MGRVCRIIVAIGAACMLSWLCSSCGMLPTASNEKLAVYERQPNGELVWVGNRNTVPADCRGYSIPWDGMAAPVIDNAPEGR